MAMNYTEDQLNHFDKATLVQLFLVQQNQLKEIDHKLVLEQLAVMNNNRFGRSSEKLNDTQQISFAAVDGQIVLFNEVEALADSADEEEIPEKIRSQKRKGNGQKT